MLETNGNSQEFEVETLLNRLFPKRKIQKVLLINPPDASAELFKVATAKRHRYTNYPPYGLAVLATNLKAIGVDVEILNLNHHIIKSAAQNTSDEFQFDLVWKKRLSEKLSQYKPDFVGVTCMFTMTHTSLKRVVAEISSQGFVVGIGGVHVSNDVERVLEDIPETSVAFLREGDNSFKNFLNLVNKNADTHVDDLGQVILVDGKKRIRFLKEVQPTESEMNTMPAHELITDLSEHSAYGTIGAFYWLKPPGTRFATILSNRGCRARCTFCSVRNFNGDGVRQRSVVSVVDELEMLRDKFGIKHVMWLDDDLLFDQDRAMRLFNEIIRRNLGMTWDATNGLIAFSCTDEMISAAEESGCIAVNIGMESGNTTILKQVKKPGKVETFLKAAEVLRKHEKIHSSVLLMVGFPGETLSMIFDTVKVAQEMDLDWYRISPLQPLPNTPIYDSMVAQGLIKELDTAKVVFQGGAYGHQQNIEQSQNMISSDFKEAFSKIPMNSIPTSEQITDIWFYMNYHLNFRRLFHEDRPVKLVQQMQNLKNMADIVAPENGFALYFQGVLQYRMEGRIDAALIERLKKRLSNSSYWNNRLSAFGLSVSDLENMRFERASTTTL